MENNGIGVGDAMLLAQNGGGNCAWFMWIIVLFALMGGNGWGNNRGDAARIQDVYASNDNQTLNANVRDLSDKMFRLGNGISDATFAINGNLTTGFSNLGRDVAQGTYVLDKAVNETRFAGKDNACMINRNIDQLRFDNQINAQGIQAAIHAEGEETRKLITMNQMKALEMALAEKDRQLQTKDYALYQQNQTYSIKSDVINAVRPFPVPSFPVGNPYGSGCNCGCSVYNG